MWPQASHLLGTIWKQQMLLLSTTLNLAWDAQVEGSLWATSLAIVNCHGWYQTDVLPGDYKNIIKGLQRCSSFTFFFCLNVRVSVWVGREAVLFAFYFFHPDSNLELFHSCQVSHAFQCDVFCIFICIGLLEQESKHLSYCKSLLIWKSVSCKIFKLSTVVPRLFTHFQWAAKR